MKILLVNSNRYHHPPVIPLALEYMAGALNRSSHQFDLIDLCFSNDPHSTLTEKIKSYNPDIVGITFRQIDTVLFHTNEYYVEDLSKLVSICREQGKMVILGGAGFSIAPDEILKHTRADYGICGPGELALIDLLDRLENDDKSDPVIDGYGYFPCKTFPFARENIFDYDRYLHSEGTIGFRTQTGCNEKCMYCPEQNKKIIPVKPEVIAGELLKMKENGYNHFHLCDSEFNLNLDHSLEVCKVIARTVKDVEWSLYMKPFPCSEQLFSCLRDSGAKLITLSLDTYPQNIPSMISLHWGSFLL